MLGAWAAVVVGWFLMATLVVHFGSWQQSIRFYDLLAVINDPGRRLTGINRPHPLLTFVFSMVCCGALLAPAAPLFMKQRGAWLGCLAPFILMALTCATLYAKTSMSYSPAEEGATSVSAFLSHAAQGAVGRISQVVATHISVGAGGYLAFLACAYLALSGARRFHAAVRADPDVDTSALASARERDAGAGQIEP
ncbi:MAG TPA: hypothetical protein VII35_17490 [Steroidobacteraceae bacterium]